MNVVSALALDIGGTKIAAGVVDSRGRLRTTEQVPTPEGTDADHLLEVAAGLLARVRVGYPDAEVCGVGCGGPMSPGGEEVSPLNIGAWRSFPLRRRLAASTGLATFVDNDAKALALGEGWRGAAAGQSNYIAMVVSTGVGGGIVVDERLLDGAAGNAGHIGP